jgi:AraC-like DNA-binding protein
MDQSYDVGAGQAFMVEIPSDHHYFLPASSESWEFYFILFRQMNILEQWNELLQELGPVPTIPKDSTVIQYLRELFQAASQNRITDGYIASAMVYQFVMELFRFSSASKKEKQTWPLKIQQAVENLESQYNQLQSLDEIAQAVSLSKYHFTRVFTKATGLTPIEYLTKIRIEKSIDYLRHSSLSIDEIAKKVGYANGSYYIKVFRQWVGFPPGEFRLGRDLTLLNELKFD